MKTDATNAKPLSSNRYRQTLSTKTNPFNMKKHLYITLFVLLGGTTMIQAQDKLEAPYSTQDLSKAGLRSVELQTAGGSLSVIGVPAGEARLEMYVKPNNGRKNLSKQEIAELLEKDYDIVTEIGGGHLSVVAKAKKTGNFNWKNTVSISYRAYVPVAVSSSLKTSGGSIRLENLKGKQDFATSGGSIRISKVDGALNGKTSGGSIHISNSSNLASLVTSGGSIKAEQHTGNLRLITSGGSIQLKDLDGSVEAKTSGGSITASSISGDLVAATSGGSVRVDGMDGNLEASTSAGGVNVSMTKLDKYVKLKTSAGSVNISLPNNKGLDLNLKGSKVNVAELNNFSGSSSKSNIQGSMNGGGTLVTASTSSGSVNLSFN